MQSMQRAYFDYDRADLRSDARSAVDSNVSMLNSNSDIKIEVQGHADERGTTQYNMALGQRRANQVVRYMTNNGISSSRLRAVSYGEERQLARDASGRLATDVACLGVEALRLFITPRSSSQFASLNPTLCVE